MNREIQSLVCFALREEAAAFGKLAAGRADLHSLITGIGRKNAESRAGAFLKGCRPQFVLTCGFAGGLDPTLEVGDVVFATDDPRLREKLGVTGARPGTFFCASRVAITRAEKSELRRTTGADAVEMESEAIHAICRDREIPCATVRAVSDTAHDDLPLDFNQLSKPNGDLNYGRLAWALVKAPRTIPALLRLQQRCRFAAGRLARVLAKVIEATLPPRE